GCQPGAVILPGPRLSLCAKPRWTGEHADDLVADLLGIDTKVQQGSHRHPIVFARDSEQDVLRTDVVVTQREPLAQRELEHLLCARSKGDLAGRDIVPVLVVPGNPLPYLLECDDGRLSQARGD